MRDFLSTVGYIDPNTGSLVLQMIIASFVGAGVFFRRAIGRIFKRGGKDPESSEEMKEEEEDSGTDIGKTPKA
jgi:hypothetical protein